MANALEILVKVLMGDSQPKLDGLKKSIADTGTAADKSSSNMTKWGKSIASSVLPAVTAGAAVLALGKFLKDSTQEAAEAEKIQAQLSAVLESTGGAAGMTAESVNRLATNLSNMSGVEDDAIVKAEAMMLTFTKIGKEVFPGAMTAALNLSRAFGTDLQSAVVMVGKALQDPISGVTTLQRVGVQLSDTQKDQIKNFMELNDVAAAQGVILGELETQVGGVAKAYGETYAGQVDKLTNAWGNFKEEVGGKVIPVLTDLLEAVNLNAEVFGALDEAIAAGLTTEDAFYDRIAEGNYTLEAYAGALEWLNGMLDDYADKDEAARTTVLLGSAMEESATQADILAEAVRGSGEAADETDEKFKDWASTLDTNLSKSIENALDKLEYLANGGDVLTAAFEKANEEFSAGRWTMEKYREEVEKTYLADMTLQVMLDRMTAQQAAENISETLNMTLQEALDLINELVRDRSFKIDGYVIMHDVPEGIMVSGRTYPLLGGRAEGGSVSAMTPYLVGERGPEVFMPRTGGEIVSNDRISVGGGGQTVVNVNFYAPVMGFSDEYDLALKLEPIVVPMVRKAVGR